MTKDDYLEFIKDTRRVLEWIGDNIENEENALTLITWINKMATKLDENFRKLEELKEEQKSEEN